MKLSLAWLCDHLVFDSKISVKVTLDQINVSELINRLSQTTAEIESVREVNFSLDHFVLARVTNFKNNMIQLKDTDGDRFFELDFRIDLLLNDFVLLSECNDTFRYARLEDLGGTRSDMLPALFLPATEVQAWKSYIETKDYILEIDNKSINHRPDLWGHRGFAREVATIISAALLPEMGDEDAEGEGILQSMPIERFQSKSPVNAEHPFEVEIQDFHGCKRLAVLSLPTIENVGSHPMLASRLARIDSRPIRSFIDLTNYVMFDMGQPLHAFDADKIFIQKLVAQRACKKEKMQLLDGTAIELAADDIIISDGKTPLALAGIMGGAETAVTLATKSILLEAANFDAHSIRVTSQRVKKRTDASARFEKSLDPNQNVPALQRAVKILRNLNIPFQARSIISIGDFAEPIALKISHREIEQKLGFSMTSEFVIATLTKLGFGVGEIDGEYRILVPTYRSTKDIKIKEDIVEEIGRFLLYYEKQYRLPYRQTVPFDTSAVYRTRLMKETLANALAMHEVYNYNLYDNEFLKKLSYTPLNSVQLKNPVSEHWQLLVTSLIPHLLKNVMENQNKYEQCRFFELANCWKLNKDKIEEKKMLAGIFWVSGNIDFYEMKALMQKFFHALKLDVSWQKCLPEDPWWLSQKTAQLLHKDRRIGLAGVANNDFFAEEISGNAFIFEIDGDFLISSDDIKTALYKPVSRFQPVQLDVSLLVPIEVAVSTIEEKIVHSDSRITATYLIDMYEKKEWQGVRSLTLRFILQDNERTLTSEDIDIVLKKVHQNLTALGGQIR